MNLYLKNKKIMLDYTRMFTIYLIISITFAVVVGCPSECICKWKGGKQTVECGGKYLTRFPDGMDQGTQVLNFSGNSLTILPNERFQKMDLINLQKIYLSRNQIIRIHDRAFRGLSNLVELDFTENVISTIPTETFVDYPSLMRLILNGNPIKEIKTSAFRHLSYLTTLELSNCQIERIQDGAFMGLEHIEWLRLDGNRITFIKGSNILPTTLHGISLQANRWNCDCNLIDIHTWLNRFNVPQIEEPKCKAPTKLAGRLIKHINVAQLACVPEIEPIALSLEVAEGRNISLLCKIRGTPDPQISWRFQGQSLNDTILDTSNFHLYYDIMDFGVEKHTEMYIYNVNIDDNGTFSCVAENAAGRTEANYTIRVIVKEEPIVEQVTFPYEYFLVVASGAICVVLIFFITICILFCRCRQRSLQTDRKRKKLNGKELAFQLDATQKCASITNDADDTLTCSKLNGSILMNDNNPQDMILYIASNNAQNANNLTDNIPISLQNNSIPSSQYNMNSSSSSYQLVGDNPDLINDAEARNVKADSDSDKTNDRESDMIPQQQQQQQNNYGGVQLIRPIPTRFNTGTLPRGMTRDMYQHQVDVHLNPGCFLDANGFPLPEFAFTNKIQSHQGPVNYYRTLPHKKHQQHSVRFSNDAEFISPRTTQQTQTCQTYAPDIRYTIQGYPYSMQPEQNFPSPPDEYKSEVTSVTTSYCISPTQIMHQQQQQWPPVLPGYNQSQVIPIMTQNSHEKRYPSPQTVSNTPPPQIQNVSRKCVGAQTSDNDTIPEQQEEEEAEENEQKMKHLSGPLADSPDEGYVGDSQDGSDM